MKTCGNNAARECISRLKSDDRSPEGISMEVVRAATRTVPINWISSCSWLPSANRLASDRRRPATSRTYFAPPLHDAFVDGRRICTLGYSVNARTSLEHRNCRVNRNSVTIDRKRERQREGETLLDSEFAKTSNSHWRFDVIRSCIRTYVHPLHISK